MSTDDHITLLQNILRDLNSHIDGLERIVIIKRDGTLLAQIDSMERSEKPEATLAKFARLADELCRILDRGSNTEAIVKGKKRFLALYRTHGANTMLGILGDASVNLGLLNSGCRSAIGKIESIITE